MPRVRHSPFAARIMTVSELALERLSSVEAGGLQREQLGAGVAGAHGGGARGLARRRRRARRRGGRAGACAVPVRTRSI